MYFFFSFNKNEKCSQVKSISSYEKYSSKKNVNHIKLISHVYT